jgi:very-short-patch-repair endonuclease
MRSRRAPVQPASRGRGSTAPRSGGWDAGPGRGVPARTGAPVSLRQPSKLEAQLARDLDLAGVPAPETEYRFHPTRKWRFDFAWPAQRVACEVEGGIWSGGRHVRGSGFANDCDKYNAAQLAGWRVLRVTGQHIRSGQAQLLVREALSTGLDA